MKHPAVFLRDSTELESGQNWELLPSKWYDSIHCTGKGLTFYFYIMSIYVYLMMFEITFPYCYRVFCLKKLAFQLYHDTYSSLFFDVFQHKLYIKRHVSRRLIPVTRRRSHKRRPPWAMRKSNCGKPWFQVVGTLGLEISTENFEFDGVWFVMLLLWFYNVVMCFFNVIAFNFQDSRFTLSRLVIEVAVYVASKKWWNHRCSSGWRQAKNCKVFKVSGCQGWNGWHELVG